MMKSYRIQNWIVECFDVSQDAFIIATWHVNGNTEQESELCDIQTTDKKQKALLIWSSVVQAIEEMVQATNAGRIA